METEYIVRFYRSREMVNEQVCYNLEHACQRINRWDSQNGMVSDEAEIVRRSSNEEITLLSMSWEGDCDYGVTDDDPDYTVLDQYIS